MRNIKKEVLSIVICTHNRSNWLATVLETLVSQTAPQEEYEILVVDNHSEDDTKRIVDGFAPKLPNMRYVYEPEIGLSLARNRGWKEAHGEYIGYLDDDSKTPPEWVSAAMDVAIQVAPEAFGGPIFAFYNSPKPAWFKDEYESHVQGNEPRRLNEDEYLDGGNMFIRRDILVELKGFNPALGMAGKKIGLGEETSFIDLLREKYPDAKIFYEPRLFIFHLARPEKMDLWQLPKRFFINGQYVYRTHTKAHSVGIFRVFINILLAVLRLLKSCTWDLIRRDKNKYPYFQNFLYENSFIYFLYLGRNFETLLDGKMLWKKNQ